MNRIFTHHRINSFPCVKMGQTQIQAEAKAKPKLELPEYRIECDIWHIKCMVYLVYRVIYIYKIYTIQHSLDAVFKWAHCCIIVGLLHNKFGISRHFWHFIDLVSTISSTSNQSFIYINSHTHFVEYSKFVKISVGIHIVCK